MGKSLKDIREISKEFSILYVEDEKNVRIVITKTLNMMFNDVLIAENGKVGLEIFKKKRPDIIITDIRMPIMNGLEMAKEIKSISSKTPIIITTAFNDESYFIKAIDLGIDKYIIKPIAMEPLFATVYDILKRFKDERELKEFKRKLLEEKIHIVSQSIVSNIINSLPNPVITYQNSKVLFTNNTFSQLLSAEMIDRLDSNNEFNFDDIIEKRDGFLNSIERYSEDDISLNRISIKHKYGHQIFLLHKRVFTIDGEKYPIELFSLNNISLQEYQKNKLKRYTEMLEEFIFHSRYTKAVKIVAIESKKEKEQIPYTQVEEKVVHKLNINNGQMASLRKSHEVKTTASNYVSELDVETLQDMQELNELEYELKDLLEEYTESKEAGEFYVQIAKKLESYSQTIQILIEFDELAFAIHSFSELLIQEYKNIDAKTHKKLTLFIKNFVEDLVAWRETIFVTQSTIDIHYLDSSLLSAILQVEISLTPGINEIEDEDNDDLVLF